MSCPPALYLFSAQGGEFSLYAAPVPSAGASARSGAADTPRSATLPRPRPRRGGGVGGMEGGGGGETPPPPPSLPPRPTALAGSRVFGAGLDGDWGGGWGGGDPGVAGDGGADRPWVLWMLWWQPDGWMDVGSRGRLCPSRIFLRSGLAVHNYLPGKPLPQKAFAEGAFAEGAAAAIAEPWTYLDSVGFYY